MRTTHNNPAPKEEYKERVIPITEDIRGAFFRDHTKILHSLPFRRLKHKTQVFFAPEHDHVCTRMEHVLHVATIAATIAKGLNLNFEMAYSIGLGHDLGHAPFGHTGETVLSSKTADIGGFKHELHGLRVVDKLGNRGESLNLTFGVRDGIVCHCGEDHRQRELKPREEKKDISKFETLENNPYSFEGCITRISDRIAYIGRDLEDAELGVFIDEKIVPEIVKKKLGNNNREIINTLVLDVINYSKDKEVIGFSEEIFEALNSLSEFSNKHIYNHEKILKYKYYCERIIKQLFEYLMNLYNSYDRDYEKYSKSEKDLDRHLGSFLDNMDKVYENEKTPSKRKVSDFIAGMTDDYALRCVNEITIPQPIVFDTARKR